MEHVEDGEIEEASARTSSNNGNISANQSLQNKERGRSFICFHVNDIYLL